jgi:hypothetical protein
MSFLGNLVERIVEVYCCFAVGKFQIFGGIFSCVKKKIYDRNVRFTGDLCRPLRVVGSGEGAWDFCIGRRFPFAGQVPAMVIYSGWWL